MMVNVGTSERRVRLILGLILLALPFVAGLAGLWAWVSGIAGVVLIATGALRFCPAWAIFGVNTCRRD